MFQSILVPLDGSVRAEQAIPVAARIAHASGGTITLLRVLSTTELLPYIFAALEPSTYSADLDTSSAYLQAVAQGPDLTDITVRTAVHTGLAASIIHDRVRADNIDLIVMTSHGHSGLVRWALGSVASKVARQSEVPVLVIHEEESLPAAPPSDSPLIALVALDGSPAAEAALAPATQMIGALAGSAPSQLHLLHVVPPSAVQDRREAALETAKEYLRKIADQLKTGLPPDSPFTVTWSVVQNDDVAGAVMSVASGGEDTEGSGPSARCALIALTTHGQGGAGHNTLGSVAERTLNDSRLPLLVVHPSVAAPVSPAE
jgi:nucleotide-binding universal stress UspA family protein